MKGDRLVCVEIGSWHGRSSRAIADNLPPNGILICCDTFVGSSGEPEMHGSAHLDRGDHAFQWWLCNVWEHVQAGRVIPMRAHSVNAAHTLNYLGLKADVIFIDASHDYENVKADIEAWLPLLKPDGIMCGHDFYPEGKDPFAWMGVRQAVLEKFSGVQKAATSIWWTRPHEQERGHVFDCFLFHNELDVLEIRLATLNDVVDYFVLVEAGETHSGEPKPLHFDENKGRFAPYLHKVRHVVLDRFPEFEGSVYDKAWARERYQRDAAMLALEDARPDDIVIIGDADEIASPEAVASYKVSDGLVRLKQRMFYYYLNCENKDGWDWQKIAPYSLVKERTPCGIRYPPAGNVPLIEAGGWHFSMTGGPEAVKQKLRDYSHQEYNTPQVLGRVDSVIRDLGDIFGRDLKYDLVSLDSSYPQYVLDNKEVLTDKGIILHRPQGMSWNNPPVEHVSLDLSARHWTVTASVSTKDRYTTTLPLTLSAIFNQTQLPDRFILYDDSDNRIPAEQLCQQQPFEGLFKLATDKGVKWEIQSTPRLGQVANHQHCLDTTDSQFIWRVDDDEIPEPDCLENLLNTIRDYERGGSFERVGAVGGLIHHPGNVPPLPESLTGSLADIDKGNLAWFDWNSGPREVEHLYSSFIYNVAHAREVGGYPRDLSPVGHREESWFTNKLHRAGYKLLITPHAKTHHLRASTGGIRSYNDTALWEHDEQMFRDYLKACDVVLPESKLIVCDYGLGDTLILRGIWPELVRKFPDRKWTLSLCYPEVFKDVPNVTIVSIADAKLLVGDRYPDYSLYKWCWDSNWTGSIVDAMREFYSR